MKVYYVGISCKDNYYEKYKRHIHNITPKQLFLGKEIRRVREFTTLPYGTSKASRGHIVQEIATFIAQRCLDGPLVKFAIDNGNGLSRRHQPK